MNNEIKTNDNLAGSIRLIGILLLAGGLILFIYSQLMETTNSNLSPDETQNALQILTDKLNNIKLLADKTKYTILGGFMIIVGLQLSLVSNQIISQIKEQFKKPL